jgi:hypothetical protein
VVELVLEYYWRLRSVLKTRPQARAHLTRCRHCRIFFLADPRNAGRKDLGCPFGCQEAHRKTRSTRRSVAYYREPEGKTKKAIQNARRGRATATPVQGTAAPVSRPLVHHVRRVVSWIEQRRVSRREILEMLERVLRQHSMARRRRIDQAVDWLNANPP